MKFLDNILSMRESISFSTPYDKEMEDFLILTELYGEEPKVEAEPEPQPQQFLTEEELEAKAMEQEAAAVEQVAILHKVGLSELVDDLYAPAPTEDTTPPEDSFDQYEEQPQEPAEREPEPEPDDVPVLEEEVEAAREPEPESEPEKEVALGDFIPKAIPTRRHCVLCGHFAKHKPAPDGNYYCSTHWPEASE